MRIRITLNTGKQFEIDAIEMPFKTWAARFCESPWQFSTYEDGKGLSVATSSIALIEEL